MLRTIYCNLQIKTVAVTIHTILIAFSISFFAFFFCASESFFSWLTFDLSSSSCLVALFSWWASTVRECVQQCILMREHCERPQYSKQSVGDNYIKHWNLPVIICPEFSKYIVTIFYLQSQFNRTRPKRWWRTDHHHRPVWAHPCTIHDAAMRVFVPGLLFL